MYVVESSKVFMMGTDALGHTYAILATIRHATSVQKFDSMRPEPTDMIGTKPSLALYVAILQSSAIDAIWSFMMEAS